MFKTVALFVVSSQATTMLQDDETMAPTLYDPNSSAVAADGSTT